MENKSKDFKEKRFDFTVYVNDNIIAKRNFSIFNYVEGSVNSLEFKDTVDAIVGLIKDDLASKSRVYLWHFYNPERPEDTEELVSPRIEDWECTFKVVISDNKHDVYTRIWDGGVYPRYVRERVDLSNKSVKLMTKDGRVYTYDKDEFFAERGNRLSFEQELIKGMIMDKQDVLQKSLKMLCEVCSPSKDDTDGIRLSKHELQKFNSDYTFKETFGNDDKSIKAKKTYSTSLKSLKLAEREWERLLKDKTDKYFDSIG